MNNTQVSVQQEAIQKMQKSFFVAKQIPRNIFLKRENDDRPKVVAQAKLWLLNWNVIVAKFDLNISIE